MFRASIIIDIERGITGIGDSENLEIAEKTAALHALLMLHGQGLMDKNALPIHNASAYEKKPPIDHIAVNSQALALPLPGKTHPTVHTLPPLASDSSRTIKQKELLVSIEHSKPLERKEPIKNEAGPHKDSLPINFNTPLANAVPEVSGNQAPGMLRLASQTPVQVNLETAENFLSFYCRHFKFSDPILMCEGMPDGGATQWTATLTVQGKSVGVGWGQNKRQCASNAYVDSCIWLATCDPQLWKGFQEQNGHAKANGSVIGNAKNSIVPSLNLDLSANLNEQLKAAVREASKTELYKKAVQIVEVGDLQGAPLQIEKEKVDEYGEIGNADTIDLKALRPRVGENLSTTFGKYPVATSDHLTRKSDLLKARLQEYENNPYSAKMRADRAALPVWAYTKSLLRNVQDNPVLVVVGRCLHENLAKFWLIFIFRWPLLARGRLRKFLR